MPCNTFDHILQNLRLCVTNNLINKTNWSFQKNGSEKKVMVSVCLNGRCCSAGCVGYGIVLAKIKAMRFCQCNFSGIFKRRQIIPEPYRNAIYFIRSLLWWQKTLLEAFERTYIPNKFKHLRWSVFAPTVIGLKLITGHAKTLHLRCWKGLWMCFCWKAR